ncbi:MAG: hypothetical protein GC165_14210 [Armatimonadetes bacterium]|nr:hypothetical protein [Armatimonadota bacterium]
MSLDELDRTISNEVEKGLKSLRVSVLKQLLSDADASSYLGLIERYDQRLKHFRNSLVAIYSVGLFCFVGVTFMTNDNVRRAIWLVFTGIVLMSALTLYMRQEVPTCARSLTVIIRRDFGRADVALKWIAKETKDQPSRYGPPRAGEIFSNPGVVELAATYLNELKDSATRTSKEEEVCVKLVKLLNDS